MLKSDLDVKEEEVRERIKSGILMMGDGGDHELNRMSSDNENLNKYKLVLVVNKSFNFTPETLACLVGRASGLMVKLGMLEEGVNQQEMWEACCKQGVLHGGENTGHLFDLRLTAQCLGLQLVEEGMLWDRSNRRYREVTVLGIWGLEEKLERIVGRIEKIM